jgi:hypothetical protein
MVQLIQSLNQNNYIIEQLIQTSDEGNKPSSKAYAHILIFDIFIFLIILKNCTGDQYNLE